MQTIWVYGEPFPIEFEAYYLDPLDPTEIDPTPHDINIPTEDQGDDIIDLPQVITNRDKYDKMTHKDIYTKYMIEYDKADVTSSYPQLTEYEIATILDKAYLALIAQKFTGNNVRKVPVEGDVKLIEDLRPLMKTELIRGHFGDTGQLTDEVAVGNIIKYNIPDDFLYYISSQMYYRMHNTQDKIGLRKMPVRLVDHNIATKFMATQYNMPWIKNPIAYCEGDYMYVLYDPFTEPYNNVQRGDVEETVPMAITYIKQPDRFVKYGKPLFDIPTSAQLNFTQQALTAGSVTKRGCFLLLDTSTLNSIPENIYSISMQSEATDFYTCMVTPNANPTPGVDDSEYNVFYVDGGMMSSSQGGFQHRDINSLIGYIKGANATNIGGTMYVPCILIEGATSDIMYINNNLDSGYTFECSDSMAEQLISLAITYTLENVESPRLTSNLNIRGLES